MENTIDLSPEQEIARFIQSKYTIEYQADLTMAIGLLYQFEYDGIQDTLCELIYSPGAEDTDAVSMAFSKSVEESLEDLIHMHGIKADHATLANNLEIMRGIYHVQSVEDPVPYLRIIEGNTLSTEEKLAAILAQFSTRDESYFLSVLTDVEDTLLTRLYLKLSDQEEKDDDDEKEKADSKLIDNFKLFVRRYGQSHLGYSIVNMGTDLGLPVQTYLDYFANHIDTSHPDTAAMDFLSLFFLAEDSWKSPIEAYREHGERLVHNPKDLQIIEDRMQRIYESFTQYKKATDEQTDLLAL